MSAYEFVPGKMGGAEEELLHADDDDGDSIERRIRLCCDQKSSDELEVPGVARGGECGLCYRDVCWRYDVVEVVGPSE